MRQRITLSVAALCVIIGGLLLVMALSTPNNAEEPYDIPVVAERDAPAHQTITATQARAYMEDGGPFMLIDVRRQNEFDDGHIPGAMLLTLDTIAEAAPESLPDKAARVFLYCRTGVRSADAARILIEMGYENVYDFGGIVDWPYDVETGG